MTSNKGQSTRAVRERALEILETMKQLVQRSRELEWKIGRLHEEALEAARGEFPKLEPLSAREKRERSNQLNYLRADLDMSRDMHTRLEGVLNRLLALLDAEDAKAYTSAPDGR